MDKYKFSHHMRQFDVVNVTFLTVMREMIVFTRNLPAFINQTILKEH